MKDKDSSLITILLKESSNGLWIKAISSELAKIHSESDLYLESTIISPVTYYGEPTEYEFKSKQQEIAKICSSLSLSNESLSAKEKAKLIHNLSLNSFKINHYKKKEETAERRYKNRIKLTIAGIVLATVFAVASLAKAESSSKMNMPKHAYIIERITRGIINTLRRIKSWFAELILYKRLSMT